MHVCCLQFWSAYDSLSQTEKQNVASEQCLFQASSQRKDSDPTATNLYFSNEPYHYGQASFESKKHCLRGAPSRLG